MIISFRWMMDMSFKVHLQMLWRMIDSLQVGLMSLWLARATMINMVFTRIRSEWLKRASVTHNLTTRNIVSINDSRYNQHMTESSLTNSGRRLRIISAEPKGTPSATTKSWWPIHSTRTLSRGCRLEATRRPRVKDKDNRAKLSWESEKRCSLHQLERAT